jgi:hypothetical protein
MAVAPERNPDTPWSIPQATPRRNRGCLTGTFTGTAQGVLGCFNAPNAEITRIQGWNWYAGADPTQIGAGQ